jgi:hypothetical protein
VRLTPSRGPVGEARFINFSLFISTFEEFGFAVDICANDLEPPEVTAESTYAFVAPCCAAVGSTMLMILCIPISKNTLDSIAGVLVTGSLSVARRTAEPRELIISVGIYVDCKYAEFAYPRFIASLDIVPFARLVIF